MAWFKKRTRSSYIGIDIGASGMKIVELSAERGRARLLTYGFTEQMLSVGGKLLIEDPERAADVLKTLLKTSGAKSRRAVASLPVSGVFSSVIAIPEPKNQEEARPLIEAQARKLSPLPLEEMVLSSTFVDPVKKESALKKEVGNKKETKEQKITTPETLGMSERQKNVRVLISAAPRSLVQNYVDVFKRAGVELVALDVESFGLIRSLIGKDRSTILLVDIGARRTNLTVVEKGIPFFTRSVQVGGHDVTQAIAEALQVTPEEAEQMKFDLAMSGEMETVPSVVKRVFGQLVNEVSYVFEQYQRQELSNNKRVEKVILTGGSSHLPGLKELFVTSLNLNTYLGDPWARVVVPEDLRLLLDTVGPGLSIATGLAMRDLD